MRANSALVTEPAQSWKRLQGAFAFKNSTKIEIYLPRRGKKGIAPGNGAQRLPPWIFALAGLPVWLATFASGRTETEACLVGHDRQPLRFLYRAS